MKTFHYRGFAADGKGVTGHIEAAQPKEAREKLAARGILAQTIETPATANRSRWRGAQRGLQAEARSLIYRELAALVKAGFPLATALDMMLDTPDAMGYALSLSPIRDAIREGQSAAMAIREAWPLVSSFELAVLEAGEKSAELPMVLNNLADELDEQTRIRKHILGASAYPLFLLLLAGGIAGAVFGFMIPRFGAMFEDAGLELPWISKLFLAVGHGFLPLFLAGLLLVVAAGWWVRRTWREQGAGRESLERTLLGQRVVRWLLEPVIAQRFAGTLAMLLKSGVPLIDAVQLSGASTGFKTVEHAAERAVEELRHGVPITRALQPISAVQTHLATWIRAGDAGGDLAGMLGEALVRCREVVRRRLDQALQWVEPVMVILVGLLILGVALAILLPILSLNQSIGA
ncbi:MAG: type II secretion system F family protein [Verrucomicrobia bacterium]|nr:type II secretion system F family protein [Kiritimatiellia bacterium]MCP5488823.1 type II secretion system F family protein [Verrucomicrobiota bacterium]